MKTPSEVHWLTGIGLLAGAAILLYWICWFFLPGTVQMRQPGDPGYASYAAYEQAFPAADMTLAGLALGGALALRRRRAWGYYALWLAAGMALFLGLEDMTYDLENHMFVTLDGASLIGLLIVLCLLGLGPLTAWLLWRIRRAVFDFT